MKKNKKMSRRPKGPTAQGLKIEETWARIRYSSELQPSGWLARPTNSCSRQTSLGN